MAAMSVAYLDHAAATGAGQRYKSALLSALDLRVGRSVLDVGCGPGTDLAAMADAVGDFGTVLGVDRDEAMVALAAQRMAGRPRVRVRAGDAHALPVGDATVDRVRFDRVVQHLADPVTAFAEARRVLRPGGLVAAAEPDWDTLAIDDEDTATSRAYARYVATRVVRNGAVGRALPRLLAGAGLEVTAVTATAVLFDGYAAAEGILRMPAVAARGVGDGCLDATATRAWLARLAQGPFLAAFTLFTVVATAPGR
jgi:ubiquinone/menaquinone biosynthesis C-methylase UbiE